MASSPESSSVSSGRERQVIADPDRRKGDQEGQPVNPAEQRRQGQRLRAEVVARATLLGWRRIMARFALPWAGDREAAPGAEPRRLAH